MKYDFCGYATKNNMRCSDGRIILNNAFIDNDGQTVPLVWQHVHDDPSNVLGHAVLENRKDGVYAYCTFNNTKNAKIGKELVKHGDINALSIHANNLEQNGNKVIHGIIREVSLVMAGANPGALIEQLSFAHSDGSTYEADDDAIIYNGENLELSHEMLYDEENPDSDPEDTLKKPKRSQKTNSSPSSATKKEGAVNKEPSSTGFHLEKPQTIDDVLDTLTPLQKDIFMGLLAIAARGDVPPEFETTLKHSDSAKTKPADDDDDTDDDDTDDYADDPSGLDETSTVKDFFNSLTEDQQIAVSFVLGQALENAQDDSDADDDSNDDADSDDNVDDDDADNDDNDDSDDVKKRKNAKLRQNKNKVQNGSIKHSVGGFTMHNVFDKNDANTYTELTHSDMDEIFADAKRRGSLKDAALEHGVEHLDVLFPEAQAVSPSPEMISNGGTWVQDVFGACSKSPFARIKSTAADLTPDAARAKGYIKGQKKVEEQISLLKRETTPQTIYKIQKMDRDDVVDITDFDTVAWIRAEMRMKLEEELSNAILVGDGRTASDNDKIKTDNIRPIYGDAETYTIYHDVDTSKITDPNEKSQALVDAALLARKDYKGSGNPVFYASTEVITSMLIARDKIGRRMYATIQELADALRVSKIVEVPLIKAERTDSQSKKHEFLGLIVNLKDYMIGADKGGAVSMFDDFDIDYNRYTYLIETRCSGALTKPYSAIALEQPKNQ